MSTLAKRASSPLPATRKSAWVGGEKNARCSPPHQARGALCGNSGTSSFGSYQDAASERQIWARGVASIGVSRQPSRSITVGWPVRSATICEPQREQNFRNFPGEDSNEFNSSSPRTKRKRSRGTPVRLENAEPCVLRQVWQ